MSDVLHIDDRRLLWRCRRGMKELDVLLDRYARAALPAATAEQKRALERFLELPDPVLAAWLLGAELPAEAEFARLARDITACP
ncbi:MAG TPA: succinate dehydrogenase assembly factor 2 [Steroidobacteraceae bacterium]|nr:succinate dehydrogenase assembly factor 2 [Steroidobacteraceae bacterium]